MLLPVPKLEWIGSGQKDSCSSSRQGAKPAMAVLLQATAGCTGGGVRRRRSSPLRACTFCRGHMQLHRSPGKSLSSLLHVTVRPPKGGMCFVGIHGGTTTLRQQADAMLSIDSMVLRRRQGTADLLQRSWSKRSTCSLRI
jgi:hypothetical protein